MGSDGLEVATAPGDSTNAEKFFTTPGAMPAWRKVHAWFGQRQAADEIDGRNGATAGREIANAALTQRKPESRFVRGQG